MALIYDAWTAAQEDRGLIPPPEDPFNGSEVCSLCGEPSPELTVFRDGLAVCEDCLHDYLRAQADRYTTQYIDDNQARFYLTFWWDNLPQQERLAIAKREYCKQRQLLAQAGDVAGLKDYLDCEQDFMMDAEDWMDYVKDKLG